MNATLIHDEMAGRWQILLATGKRMSMTFLVVVTSEVVLKVASQSNRDGGTTS
jgi:hypothetical protein